MGFRGSVHHRRYGGWHGSNRRPKHRTLQGRLVERPHVRVQLRARQRRTNIEALDRLTEEKCDEHTAVLPRSVRHDHVARPRATRSNNQQGEVSPTDRAAADEQRATSERGTRASNRFSVAATLPTLRRRTGIVVSAPAKPPRERRTLGNDPSTRRRRCPHPRRSPVSRSSHTQRGIVETLSASTRIRLSMSARTTSPGRRLESRRPRGSPRSAGQFGPALDRRSFALGSSSPQRTRTRRMERSTFVSSRVHRSLVESLRLESLYRAA